MYSEVFLNAGHISRVKLLLNNRMTYSTSVNQIMAVTSSDTCMLLGIKKVSYRSLYRTITKVERFAPVIIKISKYYKKE